MADDHDRLRSGGQRRLRGDGSIEAHEEFRGEWEREALNWIAWARMPGLDVYWRFREKFYELLPAAPGRSTLEVRCGEGRVARDLAERGHDVTGVDASPTLLRAAQEAGGAGEYVRADAAALPFADASFDLVVADNSLMDIEDMPGAVRESWRVLDSRPSQSTMALAIEPTSAGAGCRCFSCCER